MKKVEWPPGSGRVAVYEERDLEFVRGLSRQHERGEITVGELKRQVALFHDLKVDLGARLLEPPKQEGAFKIPDSVVVQLGFDEDV